MERIFYKINEAAAETGLSRYFIRDGVRSGRFPHIKSGIEYLVNVPAMLEMLDAESRGIQPADRAADAAVYAADSAKGEFGPDCIGYVPVEPKPKQTVMGDLQKAREQVDAAKIESGRSARYQKRQQAGPEL